MEQVKMKELAKVFLSADIEEKADGIHFNFDPDTTDHVKSFGQMSEALDELSFERAVDELGFEEDEDLEDEIPF